MQLLWNLRKFLLERKQSHQGGGNVWQIQTVRKISKENLKYPLESYPHPYFVWTPKSDVLPHLVASMYVRKHFNMDSKKVADEMVSDLRWLFKSTLDNWEKTWAPDARGLAPVYYKVNQPSKMLTSPALEKYLKLRSLSHSIWSWSISGTKLFFFTGHFTSHIWHEVF